MKIQSLHTVSVQINSGEPPYFCLKEFLDGLSLVDHDDLISLISDKPERLTINDPYLSNDAYDTLLSGIAAEIVGRYKTEQPEWISDPRYFLAKPQFTCNDNAEKRAILLAETPSYYRARNLFCGKIFTQIDVNT